MALAQARPEREAAAQRPSRGPADRTRALRAWDAFHVHHRRPRTVRGDILDSWCRSVEQVPCDLDAAPVHEEAVEAWHDGPVARSFAAVRSDVTDVAHEGDFVAAVTDADGVIVWTTAGRDMERRAHQVAFVPGGDWDEPAVGTNALTLALHHAAPATVFSAEHFLPMVHDWVCYSAPIIDPRTGRPCGVLDLSTTWRKASPLVLTTVSALARVVEMDLAARLGGGGMTAGTPRRVGRRTDGLRLEIFAMGPGRVLLGGAPLPLPPRQIEILAILAMHPEGLSLSDLVDHLHGERAANPVTVKVELSRLRRKLGDQLQSRPYRLAGPVVADHVALLDALRAGQLHAATRAYSSPFLGRSSAAGVEDTRRYIDVAIRKAVLEADDAEALFRLSSSMPEDAYVAERALAHLATADPRRGILAARLDALDGIRSEGVQPPNRLQARSVDR